MSEGSANAVAAAVAVARALGLACNEPLVLSEARHVVIHLRPSRVVARASLRTAFPGGPKPDELIHELSVARHAADAGAPVVPPADEVDPGPHSYRGHVVTFWPHVSSQSEVDPRAAGLGLRAVHDALADYAGSLPAAGHLDDLTALLAAADDSSDVEFLRDLVSRAPRLAGQALHGDPHLSNCLSTQGGPLWHDFESSCRGPREYDLAALVLLDRLSDGSPPAREALRAYGSYDVELLDSLVPVYAAWAYTSCLAALPWRPELKPLLRDRLNRLRRHLNTSPS